MWCTCSTWSSLRRQYRCRCPCAAVSARRSGPPPSGCSWGAGEPWVWGAPEGSRCSDQSPPSAGCRSVLAPPPAPWNSHCERKQEGFLRRRGDDMLQRTMTFPRWETVSSQLFEPLYLGTKLSLRPLDMWVITSRDCWCVCSQPNECNIIFSHFKKRWKPMRDAKHWLRLYDMIISL